MTILATMIAANSHINGRLNFDRALLEPSMSCKSKSIIVKTLKCTLEEYMLKRANHWSIYTLDSRICLI